MAKFRFIRSTFSLSVLAVCSAFLFASVAPSEARPGHGTRHSAHGHHAKQSSHKYKRSYRRHARGTQRAARSSRVRASTISAQEIGGFSSFGGNSLVAEARRYIGRGNPTDRASLWCARFMNMVLKRSGHTGTGSDMARSFASYGQRISGPRVGAIAVMSRGRRGGHVGVVSGIDKSGNPIVVSGNHGRRVAEAVYPRGRVYAYVMPAS